MTARLALILALLTAPAAAQEQALDALLCRQDRPAVCICLGLVVDGVDAGGQAQLAAWIDDNPGWVLRAIGKCTEQVPA